MKKIIQAIYSVYAILLFIIFMLVAFPFILLFSLFKKSNGANLIYQVIKIWAYIWYATLLIRYKIFYETPVDKRKQYIYVANHSSYLDIPQLMLSIQPSTRILGRHDLAKIPLFGTIYATLTILVNRSNAKDRSNSLNMMKNALQNGISLFIFPEGTFNETDALLNSFYDGAFKLSIETNTPILPIIFPDTRKRLNPKSAFSFTPGICRSIVLKEVNPNTPQTQTVSELKEYVYAEMNTHLAKYNG